MQLARLENIYFFFFIYLFRANEIIKDKMKYTFLK